MNTIVIRNKVLQEPGAGVTDAPKVETDAVDSDDWPDILGGSDDWPDILGGSDDWPDILIDL